ncbi:MAG: hypothetical protein QOG65_1470 [Actinomycetota bacterium]|nr:hypothetical protein [Actinomycetota bacterium]MDQ1384091.1 hypothetical protein [Actinomycetota bacterium]
MNNEISWLVRVAVNAADVESFAILTREMVQVCEAEPGTLIYERYVSDDGRHAHLFERYVDSDAALVHLHTFEERFSARFLALVERQSAFVYGAPTAALRQVLDRMNPNYFARLDGFAH